MAGSRTTSPSTRILPSRTHSSPMRREQTPERERRFAMRSASLGSVPFAGAARAADDHEARGVCALVQLRCRGTARMRRKRRASVAPLGTQFQASAGAGGCARGAHDVEEARKYPPPCRGFALGSLSASPAQDATP